MNIEEKAAAPMIVIVGESACGKTTLIRRFLQLDLRYSRVITYTTRQPRPGEKNGQDYHFVSRNEFLAKKEQSFFAETDIYRDELYATALEDLGENKILTITPKGLQTLRDRAVPCVSVYLFVDRRARLIRALARGDDVDEACRRSVSDNERYTAIDRKVDLVLHNEGYRKTVDELALELEDFVNGRICERSC